MLKGIHLTLMIGPGLPLPVPPMVLDAVSSIQVTSGTGRSGFQISLTVDKNSPIQHTMLPAGFFDPMITRVIIMVTVGGMSHVLMDGMITRHELAPSNEPGQSTLTLTGEDLTVLMDVIEIMRPFPAMPKVAQIVTVLAPYAVLGIVPAPVPPFLTIVKLPTHGSDSQPKMTDYAYLQMLANIVGYVFYLEPGPLPGQSVAYFGPDVQLPLPQRALSVNMDAHSNVESFSVSLDGLAKKIVVMTVFDPITVRIPIPIPLPNLNVLRPPLGARLTPPAKVEFPSDLADVEPDEAVEKAIGMSLQSQNAVSGSGTLDVLRYGRVLRARQLVGVRGAGVAYDGLYYVNSVTHNIKRGEYKQSFNVSRDGLVSQTPVVPV